MMPTLRKNLAKLSDLARKSQTPLKFGYIIHESPQSQTPRKLLIFAAGPDHSQTCEVQKWSDFHALVDL
jgi:hypothetical protein